MRCFIAIDTDEEIKKALDSLQQELQSRIDVPKGSIKWVRPENMHLTLKFLGQIEDERAVEVCNTVKDVVSGHKSFELNIESVGCFGGRRPSVLWVGAGADCPELLGLQKDLERQLALAGWPEEKRGFNGHLTLCRIKNTKAGIELAKTARQYEDIKLGTVLADSVTVYQSRLTPAGPVYTVLSNHKLANA